MESFVVDWVRKHQILYKHSSSFQIFCLAKNNEKNSKFLVNLINILFYIVQKLTNFYKQATILSVIRYNYKILSQIP